MTIKRPTVGPSATTGIGVDAHGGAVIDPTENVKALAAAAAERQDDLRALNDLRVDTKVGYLEKIVDIRATCNREIGDLRALHIGEMMKLRAEHAKELGDKETDRLNAIRQVDVTAAARDAAASLTAIQTLAATTARDAETLRSLVATSAAAVASQQGALFGGIGDRLTNLERQYYQGQGRQSLSDPQGMEQAAEVKYLRLAQSQGSGKSEGGAAVWGYIVGGVGLLFMMMSIAGVLYAVLKP